MFRDSFFGGCGIGKNLMNLKVTQARSENSISLLQAFLRNITLTAPLLLMEISAMIPSSVLPDFVREILNILETVYSVIFLPLESYRAFRREDGLRLGDRLAQTKVSQYSSSDEFVPGNKT